MSHTRTVLLSLILISIFGSAHAQVRINADEAERLVIDAPVAVYPAIAKAARAKGLVKVETIISTDGTVSSAKAILGHPLLQIAAVNAVKKRKYKPHLVDGKPVSIITDVYVLFPPGALTIERRQELERQDQFANQYYDERKKCESFRKSQKLEEAERSCRALVEISTQLADDRYLEKMGANELLGHVLLEQRRYQEALDYFNRALAVVGSQLKETDAELGQLYGNIAIALHLLRDLDSARVQYKRAEQIYQRAYSSIGDGESDEFVEQMKRKYMTTLRNLLQFHLRAAEDAGAQSEVDEIKKLITSLPSND